MKRLRTAALTGCAIASVAWLGAAASAFAEEPPPPSDTTTTKCTFEVKPTPAHTSCTIQRVVISEARCFSYEPGGQQYLLWFEDFYGQAVDYAGNVVVGESVDGYYSAVRPHAKVIYDSGVHAFGYGVTIPVDDC
jgi:hypothetical protein